MNSCTNKNDISMDKQFQKHLSKQYFKLGVSDQGKYRKRASKRKCTDREYHVQDNADDSHKNNISVWLKNSKNICLRSIVNMESLIR